jgi:hypothetical protein
VFFDERRRAGLRLEVPSPEWACSAVGSAPEWHSGGHRFDPGQVHQPSLMIAREGCPPQPRWGEGGPPTVPERASAGKPNPLLAGNQWVTNCGDSSALIVLCVSHSVTPTACLPTAGTRGVLCNAVRVTGAIDSSEPHARIAEQGASGASSIQHVSLSSHVMSGHLRRRATHGCIGSPTLIGSTRLECADVARGARVRPDEHCHSRRAETRA